MGEVARTSEETLAKLGYAGMFAVGAPIGHGQGVDVWEIPCVAAGDETIIEPGMRFNLHPSVHLADGAVITSCDCWVAEEDGARRLSSLPREIIRV